MILTAPAQPWSLSVPVGDVELRAVEDEVGFDVDIVIGPEGVVCAFRPPMPRTNDGKLVGAVSLHPEARSTQDIGIRWAD